VITHVVSLQWKPGISDEHVDQIRRALLALQEVMPEIASYRCGANVGPGEANAHFGIVATFASLDDWQVYDTHPAHLQVRADLMAEWIATRSIIQFES
jgi:hypothetical protein